MSKLLERTPPDYKIVKKKWVRCKQRRERSERRKNAPDLVAHRAKKREDRRLAAIERSKANQKLKRQIASRLRKIKEEWMDISLGLSEEALETIFTDLGMMGSKHALIREFCVKYFECGYNASEAYRQAGYTGTNSGSRAGEILRSSKVQEALRRIANERTKSNEIKIDYVLQKLMLGAQEAEAEKNFSAHARYLELIAKHLGMFKERVELSGKDGKAIEIDQRTKDDVSAFKSTIDGLAKRGGKREASGDTKH